MPIITGRSRRPYYSAILCAVIVLAVGACASTATAETPVELPEDAHLFSVPSRDDDVDAMEPDPGQMSFYERQEILFSQLGSQFYARGEAMEAFLYFNQTLEYNANNSRANFGLALLHYEASRFTEAIRCLRRIRPSERLFPYDIDYFQAATMMLSLFPVTARITAIPRDVRVEGSNRVVINRGFDDGIRPEMEFVVYRVGNAVRDVETLEVIGTHRTPIARARIVSTEAQNAVAEVYDLQEGLQVQIDDTLQTAYIEEADDEG